MERTRNKRSDLFGRAGTWLLGLLGRRLATGNPAATMDRLFTSQHVGDLRLVVAGALVLLCVAILLCSVDACETDVPNGHPFAAVVAIAAKFVTLVATAFTVVGAVCAWAYKVGSARLGVVDLFACEISTLCRVVTVTDMVGRLEDRMARAEATGVCGAGDAGAGRRDVPTGGQLTSAEDYFPVFENNSRDLQSLEARVVINITSFYTYMKTVRDLMRTAAAVRAQPSGGSAGPLHADTWHNAMRDVIYMLFLALEAGRSSVLDLVEFEPEQAERLIVVLLSELKAYLFLLREFGNTDDMRRRRLLLRWDTYRAVGRELRAKIEAGVRDARAGYAEAIEAQAPAADIALAALTLELWEGADKVWPDLDLLYQEAERLAAA